MTLEQLKMLKLVAEEGSLKAASEKLYKSQPAISQGIKQLEHQLGLTLFNRQGYRLILTIEGEQIVQLAQRLLINASEIKQLSKHLAQGNETNITIAIEASYDLNRILPILEKIQSEFPQTQIVLKQEYLSGARELIESDLADIAISPVDHMTLESGSMDSVWLYQDFLINVAAPRLLLRHPDLKQIDELKDEYQIVVQDSGQGTKGKVYSVSSGQRCWYANDFSTKKTLILSGMGWGRLPEHKISTELDNGSLVMITADGLENRLALDYHAIKLKSRVMGPVAKTLWHDLISSNSTS